LPIHTTRTPYTGQNKNIHVSEAENTELAYVRHAYYLLHTFEIM